MKGTGQGFAVKSKGVREKKGRKRDGRKRDHFRIVSANFKPKTHEKKWMLYVNPIYNLI